MNKKIVYIFTVIILCLFTHRENSIHERKHVKYYQIDESAEPYREQIIEAYKEWNRRTGIVFIEGYKPYRTVTIYYEPLSQHKNKQLNFSTVGVYYFVVKKLYVFDEGSFDEIFLHESGHSIGLGHYDDVHDIMYPTMLGGHSVTETSLSNLRIEMSKSDYLLFY